MACHINVWIKYFIHILKRFLWYDILFNVGSAFYKINPHEIKYFKFEKCNSPSKSQDVDNKLLFTILLTLIDNIT